MPGMSKEGLVTLVPAEPGKDHTGSPEPKTRT